MLLLFMLSAALLTVIQTPIDWSFFAWVAKVPFVIACTPAAQTKRLLLWAYVAGFVYWLVNLYWIAPITIIGWVALCLYMGLLWPMLAAAIHWCRRKSIPLFLAVPVLVVGAERLQGFPLGGFYWRLLGHSQYGNITLIQISDIFGIGGVSFLVAMVNGFLADLAIRLLIADGGWRISAATQIRNPVIPSAVEGPQSAIRNGTFTTGRTVVLGAVATLVAITGTLVYGHWRIGQARTAVTEGPLLASLQSNVPQSVKRSFSKSDVLFDELMVMSKAAAAAGADMIVWPETMVQGILEPYLWPELRGDLEQDKRFQHELEQFAKGSAYLLVGGYGAEILSNGDGTQYLGSYNSAFLFRPDGTEDPRRYDKIHLVLFGEYIPFRHTFPWFFEQLHKFMPEGYNSDYSLEHGKRYTIFDMTVPSNRAADRPTEPNTTTTHTGYHFGVIICYEDTVPYVARNFALDGAGNKRIDWLVNISNDGWFVNTEERWLTRFLPKGPSAELPQHAAICTFRAVENRLPIIRSVNTGISCLIDSLGRIHDGYLKASAGFPFEAMRRTGLDGWFLDRIPVDSRVTFYSRHGQWLDTTCAVVFAAVLVVRCGAGLSGARAAKRTRTKKR